MANRKISDLTALTATATGDLLPIVDISEAGAADQNKKITIENLFKGIPGNVGIGTASPAYRLDVQGGNARIYSGGGDSSLEIGTGATGNQFAFIDLVGDTTYSDYGLRLIRNNAGANSNSILVHRGTGALNITAQDAGSILLATQNTERLRVDSSGNIGIGTSSPAASLDIAGNQLFSAANPQIQFNAGGPIIRLPSANTLAFLSDSTTERARIDSTGRLLFNHTDGVNLPGINNTNRGLTFEPAASNGVSVFISRDATCLYLNRNSDGTLQDLRRSGTSVGTISVTTTATAYNTSSDYRLKENVTPVTDGITRLQQLNPSRFNFIADPDRTVDGFIAHEVQDIVPEAITGEKDAEDNDGNPVYQGIDQSKLVPLLTAALQEAIAKIETLEARLTAAGIA